MQICARLLWVQHELNVFGEMRVKKGAKGGLPDTDGLVEAGLIFEDVEEFWGGSEEAHDGEGGEHEVPAGEGPPELEGLSILHESLYTENGEDVDGGGVEAPGPVAPHPEPPSRELKVFPGVDGEVGGVVDGGHLHKPLVLVPSQGAVRVLKVTPTVRPQEGRGRVAAVGERCVHLDGFAKTEAVVAVRGPDLYQIQLSFLLDSR